MIGVPVFNYPTKDITTEAEANEAFDTLLAADAANYLMGANTFGKGSNKI